MSFETIRYDVAETGVATIALDDPDTRNSLSNTLLGELIEALPWREYALAAPKLIADLPRTRARIRRRQHDELPEELAARLAPIAAELRRLHDRADVLNAIFAYPAELECLAQADTPLCRCEAVRLRDVQHAIERSRGRSSMEGSENEMSSFGCGDG